MIVNFNLDKLNKLLADFYKITGLSISVWDADLNQLCFQPEDMPSFCKQIKSSPQGNKRCFFSDRKICLLSRSAGSPQSHYCHAGLIDTAMPIKFKDHILGYIIFGQVKDEKMNEQSQKIIKKLSKELNLDKDSLYSSYNNLKKYEPDIVKSSANILNLATRYLWLSDMISINENDTVSLIDEYINVNLSDKILITDICKKFFISKNKLYSLIEKNFNMTIGSYIMSKRINKAKNLLVTTDISISEICYMVGISDYNYFGKLFKKHTGVTCGYYRKHFSTPIYPLTNG